jgi:uncharacterized membrane protein
MNELGKMLVAIGLLIALVGAVMLIAGRIGLPLGRLPGDFAFRGKRVAVFFPLGTCILISVVLTLILYIISSFRR